MRVLVLGRCSPSNQEERHPRKWQNLLIRALSLFSLLSFLFLINFGFTRIEQAGLGEDDDFAHHYATLMGASFEGVGDIVLQSTDKTCGPAALTYVLRHFGLTATEQEIAEAAGTSIDGTSLMGLAQVAQSYGLTATGLRVNFDALRTLPLPLLIYLPEQEHFASLVQLDENSILVADPLAGYLRYSRTAFLKHWKGVVLSIRYTKEAEEDGLG